MIRSVYSLGALIALAAMGRSPSGLFGGAPARPGPAANPSRRLQRARALVTPAAPIPLKHMHSAARKRAQAAADGK